MTDKQAYKTWYQAHRQEIERDFFSFLRMPSIGTDPQYAQDTVKTAEWLKAYLIKMGLQVELWQTEKFPIVFGSCLDAGEGKPTLLIYNHYDVQPVDPIELWHSPPFEPTVQGDKIYARGAVDNKGQCFYTLMAIRAWLQLAKEKQLNLKVFIEGEEESGSHGTQAALALYQEKLKADHLLVIDVDIPSRTIPAVTVGVRGLICFEVTCQNATSDLHSGVHGGIALNPNRILTSLLARLWDEQGKVTIPGFYDSVAALSPLERQKIDQSFDKVSYQQQFGVGAFCKEEGYTSSELNGIRPTLEINGMVGGYTGVGFKTVIPAKATAKISCRLVPYQDPDKIFSSICDYFFTQVPEGCKIEVMNYSGAPAYRSALDSSLVKTAAMSYEEIFGVPCRYLFCGASIPIVVKLAEVSQASVALIGVGLADDAIHAPNEHFDWERFEKGYLVVARILSQLCKK